jgi:hypothetical protein
MMRANNSSFGVLVNIHTSRTQAMSCGPLPNLQNQLMENHFGQQIKISSGKIPLSTTSLEMMVNIIMELSQISK